MPTQLTQRQKIGISIIAAAGFLVLVMIFPQIALVLPELLN